MIVTVDTFGNLISNIDAGLIETFDEPVADIAGHQIGMQTTYGRVPSPATILALVNSFGVIEIAKSEGSAADGLGTARGAPLIIATAPTEIGTGHRISRNRCPVPFYER